MMKSIHSVESTIFIAINWCIIDVSLLNKYGGEMLSHRSKPLPFVPIGLVLHHGEDSEGSIISLG